MTGLAVQKGSDGIDVNWRIRLSESQDVVGSGSTIVLELSGSHGTAIASISIPFETLNELLRPYFSIFAELQMDGSVSLETEFSSALSTLPTKTDILQLVSRALAPEMHQDEPNPKEQLIVLKHRLAEALALVDRTLAEFAEPES